MVLGNRTYSRGDSFFSILPFTDTGLPTGLSIPDLGGGSYVNDPATPDVSWSGRVRRVSITSTSWFQQAVIIDSSISPDFTGRYRTFVRARNGTAIPGRILCRLTVHIDPINTSLSKNSVVYPPVEMNIESTGTPEALDMGIIELPASLLKSGNLGDIAISLEFKDLSYVSGTTVVDIYDINIIPADECILEIDAEMESTFTDAEVLVIDQISSPEETLDISMRNPTAEILFRPTFGGAQKFTVPTERSRIWMFTYNRISTVSQQIPILYNSGGAATKDPQYDARLYKLNRYLLPRGNS
jgi:hypothetical protein